MNTVIQKTIKHWAYVMPYTHVPHNESDYEKLLVFAEKLMEVSRQEKNHRVTSLLALIAKNIEDYESHRYLTKSLSSNEVLKFLMEEHSLTQADLPEIGSQSLVSKILSGERHLTLEHIRSLSKRFGVSPAVFC
jgi:HTH-type transcriptional regulator/antitoxin HigA